MNDTYMKRGYSMSPFRFLNTCFLAVTLLSLFLPYSLRGQNKYDNQSQNLAPQKDLEFYAKMAGEVYFFNIIGSDDKFEDDEGNSTDYTGRKYKMDYSFQPVYLASLEAYARWSYFAIDGSYKSNELWQKGGSVEQSDDISSHVDDETASRILQFGIEAFNLRTSYKKVDFDFGKAKVVDAETEDVVETKNLDLSITEIDVIYSFSVLPVIDASTGRITSTRDIYIGYKYMAYTLPRIVYEMEDINPDEDESDWRYVRETTPQDIRMNIHLIGAGSEYLVHRTNNLIEPVYTMSVYFGLAESDFTFPDTEEEKERTADATMFCALIRLSPGISFKTTGGALHTSLRLMYDANLTFANGTDDENSETEDGNPLAYNFGAMDIYHGIQFAFDAYF